jgi:hypothetical protein
MRADPLAGRNDGAGAFCHCGHIVRVKRAEPKITISDKLFRMIAEDFFDPAADEANPAGNRAVCAHFDAENYFVNVVQDHATNSMARAQRRLRRGVDGMA